MEVQPSYLFQLEDGGSLSIAVHSDVPQYERFCEMIHANRGFVVEDASSADFCIVSLAAPGADRIAEELRSEGKMAIQDYWIRDSVDAEHLLPWYPYQIGPPFSLSTAVGKTASSTSTTETDERDIHELVIMSARYWPLFSVEELHRYASRKCPHRSATSFKNLYETHQVEIDARVSYLRGRLDNVLGFNGDFSRRPRMSFGAPNKHAILSIQAPSSSTVFAASSVAALMPTPTATSGSRGEQAEVIDFRGGQGSASLHHEVPYEPPNMDNSPTRSMSPIPANASAQQQPVASTSHQKEVRGTIVAVAAPAPAPERTPSVPVRSADVVRHSGAAGISVSAEDKYELAKFLVDYPIKEDVNFSVHVEPFRKTYSRGQLRSPAAWKYVNKKYGEDIRKIMNRILRKREAEASTMAGREGSPSSTVLHDDRPSRSSNRHAPYSAKRVEPPHKKITDADKQALAQWMVDHPKDPKINLKRYFEMFASEYDVNQDRTPAAWESGASRHKKDLMERQRKIILARKGKGHVSRQQDMPNSDAKGNPGVARPAKKSGGNMDDGDSELSSIDSDLGH